MPYVSYSDRLKEYADSMFVVVTNTNRFAVVVIRAGFKIMMNFYETSSSVASLVRW